MVKKTFSLLKGGEYEIRESSSKPEVGILKLDTSKSKTFLRWCSIFNLNEALTATLDWHESYYKNPTEIEGITNKQIKNYFQKLD